jgi:peptide/nickel transport system ATP-binding protein
MWHPHHGAPARATIKPTANHPLLAVKNLSKVYAASGRSQSVPIHALDSINFELRCGSSIAFVGGSGSGKSTLAMCISRLIEPDSGQVMLSGTDLLQLSGATLRRERARIHMVFQDSATAFNPTLTAAQVICEPMVVQGNSSTVDQAGRVCELVELVGLPADSLSKSPLQFSGGQRQRLAIARALAANAEIIIFDESLSGLDMSVQADIASLLLSLQAQRDLSFIFISHDLELAACLADEIAVMSSGRIVELASSQKILKSPYHAESRALVDAILPLEAPA